MPWPSNKEDLLKLKTKVEGHRCLMWKSTYESMKNYFPQDKKKGYPHASTTIVLSKSMKEEPWIEVFHSVSEFLQKYKYTDELIYVLWWANTFESLEEYIDNIYVTTIPGNYEWDTKAPSLYTHYPEEDTEYLNNRPEEFKDSKLKHEVWKKYTEPETLRILQAFKRNKEHSKK